MFELRCEAASLTFRPLPFTQYMQFLETLTFPKLQNTHDHADLEHPVPHGVPFPVPRPYFAVSFRVAAMLAMPCSSEGRRMVVA